jgi:hypothetical protein
MVKGPSSAFLNAQDKAAIPAPAIRQLEHIRFVSIVSTSNLSMAYNFDPDLERVRAPFLALMNA